MKKIEAVIREEKLEPVKSSLENIGYMGITVTEVVGRGHQKGLVLQWRAGEYRVDLLPKLKVEVVVMDEDVAKVTTAIINAARTGEMGDGKIFVLPVENAIRIRTGEEGINAVYSTLPAPFSEKFAGFVAVRTLRVLEKMTWTPVGLPRAESSTGRLVSVAIDLRERGHHRQRPACGSGPRPRRLAIFCGLQQSSAGKALAPLH